MFWQQVRHFSAQLDTMLNATFCFTGIGNILIPTWHRGPESNPNPRVYGQLTLTSPTFTMLCFPMVQDSLCQASHWGRTSWLVTQVEYSIEGGRQRCEMQLSTFLFTDFAWPSSQPCCLHPYSRSPHSRFSWQAAHQLGWTTVSGIWQQEQDSNHCYYTVGPGWAVMCCSWKLITRGFHSDLCTLAGLTIWKKVFGGLPSSWLPTQKIGCLCGTQPFSAILCGHLRCLSKYK